MVKAIVIILVLCVLDAWLVITTMRMEKEQNGRLDVFTDGGGDSAADNDEWR